MLRTVMVLASLAIFAPTHAGATTPSSNASEIPCGINLVGTAAGSADPRGAFRIVVRGLSQDPIEGASVVIDFGACTPDIRICANQPQAGLFAECSAFGTLVHTTTDAMGTATMRIVGGAANNAAGSPAAGARCARIYADGVLLGSVNVGAFDQNGGGGLNVADVSVWLSDAFDDDLEGRSDFDCSGSVTPADLAVLTSVTFGDGSLTSCAGYCR